MPVNAQIERKEASTRTNHIARTLSQRGFLTAIALAVFFGLLQIFNDFAREQEDNDQFVREVLKVASASATEAAFQRDNQMSQSSLHAIMIHEFVISARLIDDFDSELASIVRAPTPASSQTITSRLTDPFPVYRELLIDPRIDGEVGTLEIVVDQGLLLKDFYGRSLRVFVFGILRNLALTLVLLAVFNSLLTRPLIEISQAMRSVDVRIPDPIPVPEVLRRERNEITLIVEAANDILNASKRNLMELAKAETERTAMANELAHADKLRVVGQLTGGIAHDFNNLLHVILGNIEFAQQSSENVEECLKETRLAAIKAADLTHRLLAYSRKQNLAPVSIPTPEFLTDLNVMLHRFLGAGIDVEMEVDQAVSPCFADPAQLETVLINLATNARDAMPNGGKLKLKASDVLLRNTVDSSGEPRPGQYVCFSVSDQGIGMSEDTLRQAAEPFFTTKPVGRGSGLGLSMAVGFAEQSSGSLKLQSKADSGTTVSLYLPKHTGNVEAPAGKPAFTRARSLAGLRVLVLDDESMVAATLEKHLRSMGVEAHIASDASMAIAVSKNLASVDVFLLDVVLPGDLNGVAASKELKAIHPHAKVIFMSGYTKDRVEEELLASDVLQIMQKPITRESLIAVLQNAVTPQTD